MYRIKVLNMCTKLTWQAHHVAGIELFTLTVPLSETWLQFEEICKFTRHKKSLAERRRVKHVGGVRFDYSLELNRVICFKDAAGFGIVT